MRYILDLDRFDPGRLRYAVGAGRVWISVITRPQRTRWWQFWLHRRRYQACELFDAPLSERLLAGWVRRLERPTTTFLRPWEKHAPRVEFRRAAVREGLLREIRRCLEGYRGMKEAEERIRDDPNEVSLFLSGRVISEDEVEVHRFLVNGEPRDPHDLEGPLLGVRYIPETDTPEDPDDQVSS